MGDRLDALMQIVPIAATGLLALMWVFAVRRCMIALSRLADMIEQMRSCCQCSYPEAELHPLLRRNKDGLPERTVTSAVQEDQAKTDFLSRFPDPEEEKAYPYYRRTGQIVCNTSLHESDQLQTGGWYRFPQWTQDMLAGKVKTGWLICPDFRTRR